MDTFEVSILNGNMYVALLTTFIISGAFALLHCKSFMFLINQLLDMW